MKQHNESNIAMGTGSTPHIGGGHLDPRDKKKTHFELTMEIEEIKKKKNRDMEDIKLIKVELYKMETLYKKYKELLLQTGGPALTLANFNIELPFS